MPTDDPEVIETAFRILSDWAYAISFSPDEVELERKVVLEEWRLYQGLSSRLQDRLLPLLLGDSRYAERNPIGLPEVIETASPGELRAFYERWYRPSLMAVVAVGDFDPEAIEAQVRRHFAPPPEGEALQARAAAADPVALPRFAVPDHDEPRIEVFTDPESPVTQVVLFRKVAPESGRDLAAFRRVVAERLALAMLNARLFERGQSADPPYLGGGGGRSSFVRTVDVVTFSATVEPGGVERGFGALLEELQRVRRHGFTATELEREKANLLSSAESAYLERDQRLSGQLAQAYAGHFLSGVPEPGVEAEWELYQALLPRVSLAEVEAATASWTAPGNTALLVLRPESAASGPATDNELAAALRAQLEGAGALAVTAYEDAVGDAPLLAALPEPGVILAEERIEAIDAVRWTLSNGITVIAMQTDFRNDEVLFGASSPGGHSLVADADYVSAQHAASLAAGSGAGAHDRVALDKLLAGKRVWVAPYVGELFEGLSGSASPDDLETLFQLISLYVTEPRFDADYFATYEAQLRSAAEARAAQPDTVFYDTVTAALSQDHFRHRPLTPELLDELSLERARAVYADRFADLGDATFVFVGAFDWDDLRALTAIYLAGLPSAGRAEAWRDVGVDPPAGVVERTVRKGLEPRSQTALVFAGEAEWSAREALTLSVAGEMLGVRLRERVREELGGTYSINAFANVRPLPDPEYQVAILFGSDPCARGRTRGGGGGGTGVAARGRRAELPRHGPRSAAHLPRGAGAAKRLLARPDRGRGPARAPVRGDQPLRGVAGGADAGGHRRRRPPLPPRGPLRARRAAPRSGVALADGSRGADTGRNGRPSRQARADRSRSASWRSRIPSSSFPPTGWRTTSTTMTCACSRRRSSCAAARAASASSRGGRSTSRGTSPARASSTCRATSPTTTIACAS